MIDRISLFTPVNVIKNGVSPDKLLTNGNYLPICLDISLKFCDGKPINSLPIALGVLHNSLFFKEPPVEHPNGIEFAYGD
jgi:hypothetical protein